MSPGVKCGSVLVIESDDAIRATIEWLLSERGYHVRVARTCAEAICAGHREPLDLVLSDIVGVEPDGPSGVVQVARELGARLLLMSAQADQQLAKSALRREGVWLLPKPFTPDALVRTLREVLDA